MDGPAQNGQNNYVAHDLIDISAPAMEQSAFALDGADDPYNVEEENKDNSNSLIWPIFINIDISNFTISKD